MVKQRFTYQELRDIHIINTLCDVVEEDGEHDDFNEVVVCTINLEPVEYINGIDLEDSIQPDVPFQELINKYGHLPISQVAYYA